MDKKDERVETYALNPFVRVCSVCVRGSNSGGWLVLGQSRSSNLSTLVSCGRSFVA